MALKKMSIIIPVFNRWLFTQSALKDLAFLDQNIHEIIVVDNASSDQTQEEIQKLSKKYSNLKYIRNKENEGFGKACGRGYQAASGDIIMFLNNDIRINSSLGIWTDIYFSELNENPEQIISSTGGFVDPKKDFQFMYETFDPNKNINYLSGWILVSTKLLFNKLVIKDDWGPFSSKYFAYYEDTDLSFRANKLGIKLSVIPNNSITHFGKITSKQLNTNKLYNQSRNIFMEIWGSKNDNAK